MLHRIFTAARVDFAVFITSILVLLMLSGCANQPVVVPSDYKAVTPEDHLIVDCEIAAPPAKNLYLTPVAKQDFTIALADKDPAVALLTRALDNASRQEKMLILYSSQLIQNLQACNVRLKGLRDWKTKTEKAVLSTNTPLDKRKKE